MEEEFEYNSEDDIVVDDDDEQPRKRVSSLDIEFRRQHVDEPDEPVGEPEERVRRRLRDDFRYDEWRNVVFQVKTEWPAYQFRDTNWFAENYHINGLASGAMNTIGRTVAHNHGKTEAHRFFVKIVDVNQMTLYASYENADAYRAAFAAFGAQVEAAHPEVQVGVKLRVSGGQRDLEDHTALVFHTGSYDLKVDDARNILVGVRRSRNKRVRTGRVLHANYDELDVVPPVTVFQWGDVLTVTELTSHDAPCKLYIVLPNVREQAEVDLLVRHVDDFLRVLFESAAYTVASNMQQHSYDAQKLHHHYYANAQSLLLVYDDPALYFQNSKALHRFWQYSLSVLKEDLLTRDTELVSLVYHNRGFCRKFAIAIPLTINNPVSVPGQIDQDYSHLSISTVDLTRAPINVDAFHVQFAYNFSIQLADLLEVVRKHPGLEYVTESHVRKIPTRNRLYFNQLSLVQCLFVAAHQNPALDRVEHDAWLTVDLDGGILYKCSCQGAQGAGIDVGKLETLPPPQALVDGFDIPTVQDMRVNGGYMYDEDHIISYELSGIAQFLGHALRRQLKYHDRMWYRWTGHLWQPDFDEIFLKTYLPMAVTRWLFEIEEAIPEANKAQLKSVRQLRSKFATQMTGVNTILERMRSYLQDVDFAEKRKHRGCVAANNGVVDLRSGQLRPFRSEDCITEKCELSYEQCDCAPGECFEWTPCDHQGQCDCPGPTCRSRCAREMGVLVKIIKSLTGVDLMKHVWQTDDGEWAPPPRQNGFASQEEFWRAPDGQEYASRPAGIAVQRVTRHTEHAFEAGDGDPNNRRRNQQAGTRNFWRFMWTLGYMLTGYADKKLFVFGYGEQNNGKSLIWNALMRVFRLYFKPMHPSNIFGVSKKDDGATPGMIHVLGMRAGIVSETGRNDTLNDHAVKVWAGRDPVVIRKMRSEMIDVVPDMVAACNSNVKPKISILDDAMWSRFHALLYPITYVKPNQRGNREAGGTYKLHEREIDEDLVHLFDDVAFQQALFNLGCRAAYYYSNCTTGCPLPQLVVDKVKEFKNTNNPIPNYLEAVECKYRWDINGSVSFAEFHGALREYYKGEASFKFKKAADFRNLLEQLATTNNERSVALEGLEGTETEFITGIALKHPHDEFTNPQQHRELYTGY